MNKRLTKLEDRIEAIENYLESPKRYGSFTPLFKRGKEWLKFFYKPRKERILKL